MFSLLTGFLKWLFSKNEVHILVLGLDGAGKTTFLEQAKSIMKRKGPGGGIPLDRIPPTVGLNIARIDVDSTRVIMWDLGGQTLLRSIWAKYYSEANGLVFVIDSCSPSERLTEAAETLAGLLAHPELKQVPFLLCANKQDARLAGSPAEIEKAMNFATQCGEDRKNHSIGMSALTGAGIEESIRWIVEAANEFGERLKPNSPLDE